MKKLSVFLFVCLLTFFFTACGQDVVSSPESSSLPEASTPPLISSEPVSEPTSEPISELVSEPESSVPVEEDICTPFLACQEHDSSYHSVPGKLIDLVGNDPVMEWYNSCFEEPDPYGRPGESFTIAAFVERFQVDREDFTRCVHEDLTDEQVDAIYSGDQKQINKAFCGPLAFVNEADGELYSIYWLADHNADDYIAAGLPLDQVQTVVELAQTEEYADWNHLGKTAEAPLAEAKAIEAAAIENQ